MIARSLLHRLFAALLFCTAALPAAAGILDGQRDDRFLEVDDAFAASVVIEDQQLVVRIISAPEHYLYRHALAFELPETGSSRLGKPDLPDGKKETDDFFGEIETYRGVLEVRLPLLEGPVPATLAVSYQGCADAGLCYPPQTRVLNTATGAVVNNVAEPPAGAFESEQDRLAQRLESSSRIWAIATFLGLGLLLALTPCVLPMIPILSGIIVGAHATAGRALLLSSIYVFFMALAYTLFGVLAGLFGANLQAALQAPWTLLPFAALFVLLALAMFGLFELALPAKLQHRLSSVGRGRSGLFGAGLLGFTSALIVGPCLAPPLAGALLYISGTGDALFGGAALFALGLGMGLPLIMLSVFGAGLLPRAGNWMRQVNIFFGVVLLGVAIWLLGRLLPTNIYLLLWAALATGYAAYLVTRPITWLKAAAAVLAFYAAVLAAGALLGGRGPLSPLPAHLLASGHSTHAETSVFTTVSGLAELQAALDDASARNKPVVLDFYADWCVECVEMEHELFRQPAVVEALNQVVALQVDVTAYNAQDRALMREFNVIGPPTIAFFGPDGRERHAFRLIGSVEAESFIEHMRKAGLF